MVSPQTKYTLGLLSSFRDAVWGNQLIFRQQGPTGEYLHFPPLHHAALRKFCSPLNFTDKIVVFEEYRAAIRAFKSNDMLYEMGACIMGHPGIGKTMFLAYAVIERLRERQPVAVQIALDSALDAYVIFSADGVTAHVRSNKRPLEAHPGIWAWSDSGEDVQIPTFAFRRAQGVRVFQTTSPAPARWKEWTKQCGVKRYIMDLPSPEEVKAFALLSGFDPEQVEHLSHKWGRVPRTLWRLASDPDFMQSFKDTVVSVAAEALASLNWGTASYIFFMKPLVNEDGIYRGTHSHYIPTKCLEAVLADEVAQVIGDRQIQFFEVMSGHPDTRASACFMFETIIQRYLELSNTLTIHWEHADELYTSPGLRVRYDVEGLNHDFPFYWRAPRNCPGVDGALVNEDRVLLLQMTLGSGHADPQKGVDKAWNSELGKKMRHVPWMLLFIGIDKKIDAVAKSFANKLTYGDTVARVRLPVGRAAIPLAEILSEDLQFEKYYIPADEGDR